VGVLGLLDGLNDADAAKAGMGEVGGQLVRVHAIVFMLDVGTPSGLVPKIAPAMPRRSAPV
jgi:hypothetical protein